jgi:hypothetical protein
MGHETMGIAAAIEERAEAGHRVKNATGVDGDH